MQNKKYESLNPCWICRERILQNSPHVYPMVAFSCGHVYHSHCVDDRKTCFACDNSNILCKLGWSKSKPCVILVDDDDDVAEYLRRKKVKPGEKEKPIIEQDKEQLKKLKTLRNLNTLDTNLQNSYLNAGEFFWVSKSI